MKLLVAATAALLLISPALAQKTNPFASKATLPSTAPQVQRAVVVFAPGERATMPNQDTGYHVFVGGQGYHVAGMGPKTAGIYDVQVWEKTSLVLVFAEHPGAAAKGKPELEQFRLRIVSPYSNTSNPPTQVQVETVDGRRLIIYDADLAGNGNCTFRAVVLATKTTPETYLMFSAYVQDVTPGIYDFKLATVEHQTYVDVLIPPKPLTATHPRSSAMWIRMGLSASCEGCDPVDPMFDKVNYR